VALEHFARYLRVAWLIGSDQPKVCQAVKKEKGAESHKQESIGASARLHCGLGNIRDVVAF
jgi:hypothetical protein